MTYKNKTGLIFFITAVTLGNLLAASLAGAAQSTITISSTPFLSFTRLPDSLIMGAAPHTVPVTNENLFSDENGLLPASRALIIQDTRENGGFLLQLEASAFQPAPPTDLRNNLRLVTSTAGNLYLDLVPVNNIKYLPADGETNFIGLQTVSAPVSAASTNFAESSTFTSVSGNTLNTIVDIMNGCLETGGRKGKMHLNTSHFLVLPKFTPPPSTGDQYYSTLTYTLSDHTPVSCT